MDITTVIPTYRRQEQLAEAIESVLAQNVNHEIIVVDDCPDGSGCEAIEKFKHHPLTYLRMNPPSRGKPALVRNFGWPLAKGRFVHFLDDDDRVAKGFYKQVIETLEANPGIGVAFGHIQPFATDESANIDHELAFFADASRRARTAKALHSRRWLVANLLFMPTLLVNSACVVRRECIASLNGYYADLGLNEDVDFFCRAIRNFGFALIDQTAVHYRINPNSLMHGRKDNSALLDAYRKMYARYQSTHGTFEFLSMKILMRTVGRYL